MAPELMASLQDARIEYHKSQLVKMTTMGRNLQMRKKPMLEPDELKQHIHLLTPLDIDETNACDAEPRFFSPSPVTAEVLKTILKQGEPYYYWPSGCHGFNGEAKCDLFHEGDRLAAFFTSQYRFR